MLILKHIHKEYAIKDNLPVVALKDINLLFEDNGFVCILGHSGCGKTTLLNIIGGLDKYTSGDLIIDSKSTKDYSDADYDKYRNCEIGFVFQSYNLIPHLTIKANVELALTLSGISPKEREIRALEVLEKVGLKDQVNKKPNQLSGGQMQRVALARALINNPKIILADEPTGALDSTTSIQVMDILKKISVDHLVIMVTHNEELADKYSDRVIHLKDGELFSDSKYNLEEEKKLVEEAKIEKIIKKKKTLKERFSSLFKKKEKKHTSMSIFTAIKISGTNLLTKKGKSIITAIAASFGIIGVGLVLALSNGFTNYIDRMEVETLSKFPLTIENYAYSSEDYDIFDNSLERYPEDDVINVVEPITSSLHINNIDSNYVQYLENMNSEYGQVRYNYSIGMNVISQNENENGTYYTSIYTKGDSSLISSFISSSSWNVLPADEESILAQYDVLLGEYPHEDDLNIVDGKPDQDEFGLVLVLDSYNSITTSTLEQLGIGTEAGTYSFSDFLGKEYKYIPADLYYGDAISNTSYNSETSELETIETLGLYFKDTLTMDDIINGMSSASDFLSLFNLPSQEEFQKGIEESTVSLLPILMNIYPYFEDGTDLTNISSIDELKQALRDDLTAEDYRALGGYLYEAIITIINSDTLKPYFYKNLKYYQSPSSDEDRLEELYNSQEARTLKISAILRPKSTTSLGLLSTGIYYPQSLTYQTFADNAGSSISQEFKNHIVFSPSSSADLGNIIGDYLAGGDVDLLSSFSLSSYNIVDNCSLLSTDSSIEDYMNMRLELGSDVQLEEGKDFLNPLTYVDFITSITIYPNDFDTKSEIISYLEAYNQGKDLEDQIIYSDVGSLATDLVANIVDIISAVLIAFASISLVVSSVMIAVIIYSSVVERTKEIGILRAIGARKKDVSRLFKAEAMIIGFLAGLIGIVFVYIASVPISYGLNYAFPDVDLGQIAFLNPWHAVVLLIISVFLTYLASLFPARIAAKKDPVLCLRSE